MSASFDKADLSAADVVAETTGMRFRAGNLSFTCTGRSLLEVLEVPEISPLGGTKPWFLGLVSYRAELLPVTDFAQWAGLADTTVSRKSIAMEQHGKTGRLLVVQRRSGSSRQGRINTSEKIALLVSEVSGQVAMDKAFLIEADKARIEGSLGECLEKRLEKRAATGCENPTPLQLQTAAASLASSKEKLMAVTTGFWHSGETVFVADLERLFSVESFLQIAAVQPAVSAPANQPGKAARAAKRAFPA